MTNFNYIELSDILKIKPELFLKKNGHYIKKIVEMGYNVNKIGKGKNAVYEVEKNYNNKKLTISNCIISIFGFNPKHPLIFYKYLYFIKNNDISYMSDAEIAIRLGYTKNSRQEISRCRNQLIDHFYMIIKEDEIKYFLISYEDDGKRWKEEIPSYLFAEIYSRSKELKLDGAENVWEEIKQEYGGYPTRMQKRIKTDKLKKALNSNEYNNMIKNLNINWRKKINE